MSSDTTETNKREKGLSRRQVLTRLGLAATAAYVAPTMLQLGEAKASSFSGGRRSFSGHRARRRRSFSGRAAAVRRRRSFSR